MLFREIPLESQQLIGLFWIVLETVPAESVRFELTDAFASAVFKTAGLNHSPNSPGTASVAQEGRVDDFSLTVRAGRAASRATRSRRSAPPRRGAPPARRAAWR